MKMYNPDLIILMFISSSKFACAASQFFYFSFLYTCRCRLNSSGDFDADQLLFFQQIRSFYCSSCRTSAPFYSYWCCDYSVRIYKTFVLFLLRKNRFVRFEISVYCIHCWIYCKIFSLESVLLCIYAE